jgi:hypothetical protein
MTARTTIAEPTEQWTAALETSRARVLAAARGVVAQVLALESELLTDVAG